VTQIYFGLNEWRSVSIADDSLKKLTQPVASHLDMRP
jgi:hypothetical protein